MAVEELAAVEPPPPSAAPLTVGHGELHLWALHRPWTGVEPPPMAAGELDARERARAASFVRPRDRTLYVSAHIALRRVLALYAGTAPARLALGRAPCPCCARPHGRPVLIDAPVPLHFSLSHSQGLAVVAVAGVPVGVDVQRSPSPATTDLCLSGMHLGERREIAALPPAERPCAFAELWTRKEAYLKGLGTGLGRGLSADYLGGDPDARPEGWLVANVPGGPEHVAAAALLTDTDHTATTRTLPEQCLYADDATELITGPCPAERTALPGPDTTRERVIP